MLNKSTRHNSIRNSSWPDTTQSVTIRDPSWPSLTRTNSIRDPQWPITTQSVTLCDPSQLNPWPSVTRNNSIRDPPWPSVTLPNLNPGCFSLQPSSARTTNHRWRRNIRTDTGWTGSTTTRSRTQPMSSTSPWGLESPATPTITTSCPSTRWGTTRSSQPTSPCPSQTPFKRPFQTATPSLPATSSPRGIPSLPRPSTRSHWYPRLPIFPLPGRSLFSQLCVFGSTCIICSHPWNDVGAVSSDGHI